MNQKIPAPMSRTESLFSMFPPAETGSWKQRVLEELRGADYSTIVWKSPDGFTMEPWYNRHTATAAPEVPFRRTTNRWKICQQIPTTSPETCRQRLEEALAGGVDAIEFVFDSTARADSMETLRSCLQAIDTAQTALYFSGAVENPAHLVSQLLQIPEVASNPGGILFAPLGGDDFAGILPTATHLLPAFRPIAIDTVRFHHSGATIVQELAFALAGITDCLDSLTSAGIDSTRAASYLSVIFATGTSHFPELAKLRAFRALWPQLLRAWGVAAENLPEPHLFVRSSTRSFSVLDSYTNILRLSTEALSAVLGGCDTLQLSPFDPAGSVPDEFAERITRNIHLLFREESSLDRVVDPAAGSWYIETLTATLCREAWQLFLQIEAEGGLSRAEASGTIETMVAKSSGTREKALNTRRRTLVGINRYTVSPSPELITAMKSGERPLPATGYEELRMRMLAHIAAGAAAPRAALWLHGEPSKSLRVAAFAEDFLRSGGIEVLPGIALEAETESCRTILQHEPDIVVLCWSGSDNNASLPAICEAIRELRTETIVIMAAKPPDNAAELLKAGIDRFIYTGSDARADLLSLQHKSGVL